MSALAHEAAESGSAQLQNEHLRSSLKLSENAQTQYLDVLLPCQAQDLVRAHHLVVAIGEVVQTRASSAGCSTAAESRSAHTITGRRSTEVVAGVDPVGVVSLESSRSLAALCYLARLLRPVLRTFAAHADLALPLMAGRTRSRTVSCRLVGEALDV